jgi:hypothetical protein
MRLSDFFTTLYLAVGVALLFTGAIAAEPAGEAVAVIDQAEVEGEVGERDLVAGMGVFLGEKVLTDNGGEAQLLFRDGTRLVVGPNSSLVLDNFVFRSGSAENQFAIRALGGAFRFITGDQNKDAYLIQTPAATIGVRGTAFDFVVSPDDTGILLYHGGAAVCGINSGCTIAEAGQ